MTREEDTRVGRVFEAHHPRMTTTRYTYDGLGRQIAVTSPQGTIHYGKRKGDKYALSKTPVVRREKGKGDEYALSKTPVVRRVLGLAL